MTTTTTNRRLRASDPLAVLVLLAAGRTTRQVADATTWNRRRVVELAELRGWRHDPDTDRVIVPPLACHAVLRPRAERGDRQRADLEAELNQLLEELVSA
jgi:hypothetical protein